ncbi:hypothetical protein [Polyangium mundeleinium]|uniref:Uncharacterized protein n=1 Tax=Polyangium mundeleinium TaxID=2995306 RepID=A0ABT5EGV1_9BACT|nr:hypothetical protein [Polyangium mundeleinium]MDC0741060.1 hypothetical protein [Polyangium mundeleinium]
MGAVTVRDGQKREGSAKLAGVMRLLGSIAAVLLLSACNGGTQPPDSPQASGSTTTETAPSATTPSPTTTVFVPQEPTVTPPGGVVPTANPENPANPAPTANPTNGEASTQPGASCGGRTCGAGESCASYYGVAGPRGPMFHECVVRCRRGAPNGGCPAGQRCTTISDGPGEVCR